MKSFLRKGPLSALLVLVLSMSCGSNDDAGSGKVCTPGAQIKCACGGDQEAVQVCNDDGTGFASCDCDGVGPQPPINKGGSASSVGGTISSTGGGAAGGAEGGASANPTTPAEGGAGASAGGESSSGGAPPKPPGKIQTCRASGECPGGLDCIIAFGASGDNVGVCSTTCVDSSADCAAGESCISGVIGNNQGPLVCIPNCGDTDPCGSPTLKCAQRILACASVPGGKVCVPQAWTRTSFDEWNTLCE